MSVAMLTALPRAVGWQTTRNRCTSSLSRFGTRCTEWHPRRGDPSPEPRSAADNSSVQVIVEIEATAATIERLFDLGTAGVDVRRGARIRPRRARTGACKNGDGLSSERQ